MKTGSPFSLLFLAATSLVTSMTVSISAFADSSPTGFLPQAIRAQLAIPNEIVQDPTVSTQSTNNRIINLLDYMKAHITHETLDQLETDNAGYNRREDFGGWIVANSKLGCQDTRAIVLVRSEDSATPITYKDGRNCLVVKGLWHDPYAGQDYKLAKAMQIDHVVPLKHVYLTGGKDWAPERRCYYANFVHNPFHLLAVSGHENMSKSDKAPDQYLPPDESFQCQYVSSWMKVKAIWGLVATDSEMATIEKVIQDHHCADSKTQYTEDELKAEQAAIDDSVPTRCVDFGQHGAPSLTDPTTAPATAPAAAPAQAQTQAQAN